MKLTTASRSGRVVAARPARILPLAALFLLVSLLASGCAAALSETEVRAAAQAELRESSALHRWAAGEELVVAVSGLSEADSAEVFRGFGEWLEGSGLDLTVRPASSGERANVVFVAVDRIERGRYATGLTELEWSGARLLAARVSLAARGRCGGMVTPEERRRAIVHEIGHVLGLGHSGRFASIMHPHTARRAISDRDRLVLELLYAAPLAPARTSVASRHEEEEEER